jgi:gluconolactonase
VWEPAAPLEKLHTGARFTEGPVYFGDHRCLIFSDVPSSALLRWDEQNSQVTVFRAEAHYTSGSTRDRQGRLISCEQGTRRVTRTELDGSITVIADRWRGKRLNSPNDVVVKSDDTIWFTDPSYGISSYYAGGRAQSEIGGCNVFRFDPRDQSLNVVVDDFSRPNGLAFSPDESTLYVVDSGLSPDPKGPHHVRAFDVTEGGKLAKGRVLFEVSPGIPDGCRVDVEGNIWCTAADGVHCYAANGDLIGKVLVPEVCGNIAFGGPHLARLFICASSSIYAIYLNVRGAGLAGRPRP